MEPMARRAMTRTATLAAALMIWLPATAPAQPAQVAFGGLRQDSSLPVEIESDQLQVDQAAGTAVFTGNVRVKQGELRLAAPKVEVVYATGENAGRGRIETIHATGGVTLANASEAAEGTDALYALGKGEVVMRGNVLLTQGPNTIAGQELVIDLDAGTGRMQGRVQTVFQPDGGR